MPRSKHISQSGEACLWRSATFFHLELRLRFFRGGGASHFLHCPKTIAPHLHNLGVDISRIDNL